MELLTRAKNLLRRLKIHIFRPLILDRLFRDLSPGRVGRRGTGKLRYSRWCKREILLVEDGCRRVSAREADSQPYLSLLVYMHPTSPPPQKSTTLMFQRVVTLADHFQLLQWWLACLFAIPSTPTSSKCVFTSTITSRLSRTPFQLPELFLALSSLIILPTQLARR